MTNLSLQRCHQLPLGHAWKLACLNVPPDVSVLCLPIPKAGVLLLNPVNVTQAVGHSDFVEMKAYGNTRQKKPEHRESVYFCWDISSGRRSHIQKTALAKSQPAAVKTPSEVCWRITGEGRGRPLCCHCWWQEHAECEDLALAVLAFGVVEPKHQKWLEDV